MKPEEYRLIMRNLELHYQDYMKDSQDSQLFGPDDRMQVEGDYNKAVQHYDGLLRSMEKGSNIVLVLFSLFLYSFDNCCFVLFEKIFNCSGKANDFYPPFRQNAYPQR